MTDEELAMKLAVHAVRLLLALDKQARSALAALAAIQEKPDAAT